MLLSTLALALPLQLTGKPAAPPAAPPKPAPPPVVVGSRPKFTPGPG